MIKKLLLIPAVLLIGVGTVLALNNPAPPAKHSAHSTVQPTAPVSAETPVKTQDPAGVQTATPTTTTTPSPATPTPAFSADPNSPGSYVVYDKTSVMNDAGVPADQQAAADEAIQRVSNWTYGNFLTLCKRGAGPSSIVSADVRRSQGDFGAAVFTDAVLQLKWCVQWMSDHSLTWQTL